MSVHDHSLSPGETPTFGFLPESLKARIDGTEAAHPSDPDRPLRER